MSNKSIESFKFDLINLIEKKYLFAINSETTRKNLANDVNILFNQYVQLWDVPESISKIFFFDNTKKYEDIDRGQVILMVKAGDKELSVSEFLEKLETYLDKK